MKFVEEQPLSDPERAARLLVEIAASIQPVQEDRIYVELLNHPFLYKHGGAPAHYGAGIRYAIENGWLWMHESGTYFRLLQNPD